MGKVDLILFLKELPINASIKFTLEEYKESCVTSYCTFPEGRETRPLNLL